MQHQLLTGLNTFGYATPIIDRFKHFKHLVMQHQLPPDSVDLSYIKRFVIKQIIQSVD